MNKSYSPFYFLFTLAIFTVVGQYSAPTFAALCPTTISGNIPGCELPAELVTVTSTGSIDENVFNINSSQGISNSGIINGASTEAITNNGVITNLRNDGQINAITYTISNSGVIQNLTNSKLLFSVGDWVIANQDSGNIQNITNTGRIISNAYGGILNYGQIGVLNNSNGLISGIDYGIYNSNYYVDGGVIGTLINSGVISVNNSAYGASGIYNEGNIFNLTNSSLISAKSTSSTADGIVNSGDIASLTNSGSISATSTSGFARGIFNLNTIGALANSGSINATSRDLSAYGIINYYAIGTLTNSGSISASSTSSSAAGILNSAPIGTLTNSGSIRGTSEAPSQPSYGIYNTGASIQVLTNSGSISGTTAGIYNDRTTIFTFNNTQGGNSASASTTALTYQGNLPNNYNIGIVSPTHYGQLSASYSAGTTITNFGIYGMPLLTSRTYAGVLSNNVTVSNVQATYDNMSVALVDNVTTNAWDLTFSGISLMGTQQSLVNTANALTPVYAMQNAVLVNSFTYDCTLFDVNNICISAGGRNTQVSAANGLNNTSALLIAAYRPHPNYRIGAYADQNLSVNNAGSTVNLTNSTPLIGVFGAWTQNQEGTGAEVRVSAAYGQKDATINRQVVGLSEPGSGSSTLNNQGAQVTAKYGFGIMDKVTVSPYVGVRYTQNNMNGYTEGSSATVTAPLTYGALNTNATTALAGVGASYQVIPTVTTFASAGVETDTNTANGTYSATGINGLTPVNFNPNPVRTRPTATVGAYYDITKNQRFGVTGIYRQEAYQAVSSTTVMATYTIGL